MHVLVTGGAGYIGSHTCKMLSQNGVVPVTFDSLAYGHCHAVRWGPFVHGNLRDTAGLAAVMRAHKVTAVIHFAASGCVGESIQRPDIYYENNVVGTLSLLQAMRSLRVQHLVFSSTAATYGVPQHTPISETHPQAPVNPYHETAFFTKGRINVFSKRRYRQDHSRISNVQNHGIARH